MKNEQAKPFSATPGALVERSTTGAPDRTLVALPVFAAPYELIDLGVDVSPADINNAGTIVGSRKTDTGTIAFRWSSGGLLRGHPRRHGCQRGQRV